MSQLRVLRAKNSFYCQIGVILLLWSWWYDQINAIFLDWSVPLCDHIKDQ